MYPLMFDPPELVADLDDFLTQTAEPEEELTEALRHHLHRWAGPVTDRVLVEWALQAVPEASGPGGAPLAGYVDYPMSFRTFYRYLVFSDSAGAYYAVVQSDELGDGWGKDLTVVTLSSDDAHSIYTPEATQGRCEAGHLWRSEDGFYFYAEDNSFDVTDFPLRRQGYTLTDFVGADAHDRPQAVCAHSTCEAPVNFCLG